MLEENWKVEQAPHTHAHTMVLNTSLFSQDFRVRWVFKLLLSFRTLQFFSEAQEVIHPAGWEILLSLVILKMYTCNGFDASRVKLEPS